MNRRERRIAAKAGGEAASLHGRGRTAFAQGRPREAIAHFERALASAPDEPALHDGLAEAYRAIGSPVDAERHYRRVAGLRPGPVTFLNLGNALLALGREEEATASYRASLRLELLPEAYHGLGSALAALGQPEAADAFTRALALRPDFTPAHEALIEMCLAADAPEAALRAACQALLVADTPRLRVQFIDAVIAAPPLGDVAGLRETLHQALAERWTRPQDLVVAICDIVALHEPFDSTDTLLRAVMELAPICHRQAERALTEGRRTLLGRAALTPEDLALACGLGLQCFINEYAWESRTEEASAVARLRREIEGMLDRNAAPAETMLAAVAMYLPLATLDGAERLLAYRWPKMIAALLEQQVTQPSEERRLAGTIPALTAIEDGVSRAVRAQYEVNPYPRWVTTAAAGPRIALEDWLATRFGATPPARPRGSVLEVLIAGCGTGQQALETIRGFAGPRVLAIDLSLASLAYAARMSAALGIEAITYAQADLLRFDGAGRSFDMIGVGGVLHHLADPWSGWQALLALLRPGGVMNVLLYTVRGRDDVRQARDWIAARGHVATAEGIRSCRQELLARDEDWAVRLSATPDFYSLSGCRDLLFHVHERAVSLPQVAGFMAANGLELLGVEVPAATERRFAEWDGSDGALRDLGRWDRFEAENPRCFAGMLNIWVRKPRDG